MELSFQKIFPFSLAHIFDFIIDFQDDFFRVFDFFFVLSSVYSIQITVSHRKEYKKSGCYESGEKEKSFFHFLINIGFSEEKVNFF
ncbi:MAG TPA: hypothetical protein ENL46_04045 [Candidatus Aminicenantes bacterium]|nr:hypothetical protein [Candidatus Aminicenantes bacterium]